MEDIYIYDESMLFWMVSFSKWLPLLWKLISVDGHYGFRDYIWQLYATITKDLYCWIKICVLPSFDCSFLKFEFFW